MDDQSVDLDESIELKDRLKLIDPKQLISRKRANTATPNRDVPENVEVSFSAVDDEHINDLAANQSREPRKPDAGKIVSGRKSKLLIDTATDDIAISMGLGVNTRNANNGLLRHKTSPLLQTPDGNTLTGAPRIVSKQVSGMSLNTLNLRSP